MNIQLFHQNKSQLFTCPFLPTMHLSRCTNFVCLLYCRPIHSVCLLFQYICRVEWTLWKLIILILVWMIIGILLSFFSLLYNYLLINQVVVVDSSVVNVWISVKVVIILTIIFDFFLDLLFMKFLLVFVLFQVYFIILVSVLLLLNVANAVFWLNRWLIRVAAIILLLISVWNVAALER